MILMVSFVGLQVKDWRKQLNTLLNRTDGHIYSGFDSGFDDSNDATLAKDLRKFRIKIEGEILHS